MTAHMFVLDPPGLHGRGFWSPWKCLCGTGGTGANPEAAENQYDLHMAGYWPAYIDPVPGSEAIEWKGKTLWVKR